MANDNGGKDESNNKGNEKTNNWIFVFAIIALILLVILPYVYFHLELAFAADPKAWALFGDYLGGVLNPLLTIFAVWLVYKTYRFQQDEFAKTFEHMESSARSQKGITEIESYNSARSLYLTDIEASLARVNLKRYGNYTSYIDSEPFLYKHLLEPVNHVFEGVNFDFVHYSFSYRDDVFKYIIKPIERLILTLKYFENLSIPTVVKYEGESKEVDGVILENKELLYFIYKLDFIRVDIQVYLKRKIEELHISPETPAD
ncbi:MAG TPA: hypothetical protein VIM93_02350 [Kangiella sp.]